MGSPEYLFSHQNLQEEVSIALVAKYVNVDNGVVFSDAYASVIKALRHAAVFSSRKIDIRFINSEHLERVQNGTNAEKHEKAWKILQSCQ